MARVKITRMVDDFDRTVAADEAIVFGIDGFIYTIDLTLVNAKEMREAFQPYVDAAHDKRKWPKSARPKGAEPPPPPPETKASRTEMREWALVNGFEVKSRGQLPNTVVEAYNSRSN